MERQGDCGWLMMTGTEEQLRQRLGKDEARTLQRSFNVVYFLKRSFNGTADIQTSIGYNETEGI